MLCSFFEIHTQVKISRYPKNCKSILSGLQLQEKCYSVLVVFNKQDKTIKHQHAAKSSHASN